MNYAIFLAVGVVAGGLLGWFFGGRQGRKGFRIGLSSLLDAVRSGSVPDLGQDSPPDLPDLEEIRRHLAKGWVPRTLAREEAIREALQRLAAYLRHRVEAPLLTGLDEGGESLREGADAALDAVEDLEFFLEDPPMASALETRNLVDLVGEVTREFSGQFTIFMKVEGSQEPLRAQVDPDPLKDALFLVLHNAGEFGGGEPVQMTLRKEVSGVRILIRDRGPGFSPEALTQALSPFFSTSPGGLGLGLPYARRAVRAQGGDLLIRNCAEGGAEVEIVLRQGG